jgi:4-phytase/acid phosphatase
MRGNWLQRTCIIVAVGAALFGAAPAPQLRYTVIISRHGVRSPTWEAARLNDYSAEPWPDWGVPPGDLTSQGRELIKLMGAYYRDWLSAEHLIENSGCRSAARIYIWADTDQRTLETGRAFAESLAPGCSIAAHSQGEQETDSLFSGVGTADPQLALNALRDRIGSNPQNLLADHQDALRTLRSILTGGQRVSNDYLAKSQRVDAVLKGNAVALNGPFDTSSTLSEDFLLEYANGMSAKDLGWGRLSKNNLTQVLELHAIYADLMRRTPYIARARGSNLLAHVLRSMEQAATGKAVAGSLGVPGDVVLLVSGHDTNQSNLSGMMDLTWNLPGYQPNETPPGGALIFTLWQLPQKSALFVKAEFVAQSLDQMRDSTPLSLKTPPIRTDVGIPGCKTEQQPTGCPWEAFKRAAGAAIDPKFTRF